tara:strand:- start:983 stop:1483 length:501 start_codon:yes stop_codon:yes gene_type:complete
MAQLPFNNNYYHNATLMVEEDWAESGYNDRVANSHRLEGLDLTQVLDLAQETITGNAGTIDTIAELNDVNTGNFGTGRFLTYNGTTWDAQNPFTYDIGIDRGANTLNFTLDTDATYKKQITFQTGGSVDWIISHDSDTESGALLFETSSEAKMKLESDGELWLYQN